MQKYIKTGDGQFVLFPDTLVHRSVSVLMSVTGATVVSAGFVHRMADGSLRCIGESISLGLESLPEDTEQLRGWLS